MLIAKISSQAHELMLQFHVGSDRSGCGEVLLQVVQVERTPGSCGVVPQSAGEGALSLGEF
jgi:hypothetical protein